MTTLTVAAALALATQCGGGLDPAMLIGIGRHESGLETEILHDNGTGKVERGPGVIEAAAQLIAAGHSVDLGLMQINSRNLSLLGLSIADAFDACRAIGGAARLIQLFSRYNTGSPARGIENGYAMKVVASVGAVREARPVPAPSPIPTLLHLHDQIASFK